MSTTATAAASATATRLVTTPSGVFRTATHQVAVRPGGPTRSVLVVHRGVLPTGARPRPFVHVECTTGDVLADLRCSCGLQLRRAMRRLGEQEHGVLLYLRRDGSCSDRQPADRDEDALLVERVLDLLGRRP